MKKIERIVPETLRSWENPTGKIAKKLRPNSFVDCGWGRLIFGHTFKSNKRLTKLLSEEADDKRDIAFYIPNPHVLVSLRPNRIFLDPSHTYRIWLEDREPENLDMGDITVRKARPSDEGEINRIYSERHMVKVDPGFIKENSESDKLSYFIAEYASTKEVLGVALGVDHVMCFNDPENGSSLWSLAVSPQVNIPKVGECLVKYLINHFSRMGRSFMDVSVMHDNAPAISLYEKLAFYRVPVYCVKNKNPINEPLFISPELEADLNIYAKIIVDEARKRGIDVNVLDAKNGYFEMVFGGKAIVCRESLSQLTDAVAMSRCDDKHVTSKLLGKNGVDVPAHVLGDSPELEDFLRSHARFVVKPRRGEQGHKVMVDVPRRQVRKKIEQVSDNPGEVMVEEFISGTDLRIVVIDFKVVAAATRVPPKIRADGKHTVRELIDNLSRRRMSATSGESSIPVDGETRRCLKEQGYSLKDIPKSGVSIVLRKTANLHTGGTIKDVTDKVSPEVREAAVKAAKTLNIPVVGLDFIVPKVTSSRYAIIEANERVGLANHEPQPTAEKFIDLLFPQTRK
ncbi:MAG: N-acetylglutaminylglutamine synthetase [Candidatus Altiarchaeales archaeon]|nr:N-acetylglutaminylglutamine synthetase [Candidatus Altiarchaeales archaeon]MBD3417331.1 N-acetylglutaminylglutamine synthetase [Candidatus Altiarchaeales archaeon]